MKNLMSDFRKFVMRGNVLDLAVAVVIGGAFGTIVKSLVDDVIMPPIGYISSGIDFKNLSATIKDATTKLVDGKEVVVKPAITINYGAFINNVISFLIVAWCVFMLVKAMNVAETRLRFGQQPPEDTPPPTEDVLLLREIRDSLKRT